MRSWDPEGCVPQAWRQGRNRYAWGTGGRVARKEGQTEGRHAAPEAGTRKGHQILSAIPQELGQVIH